MQIGFLTLENETSYLLGYELKLSPTEQRLLRAIAKAEGTSHEELLKLLASGVKRGNVSVHISSINKKASKISGRKLVILDNSGYKINPFM